MTEQENSWKKIPEGLIDNTLVAVKVLYIIASIIFFFVLLLEIKRYYNIDVIPNYDSPVDDIYGSLIGTISEFFKDLFGEP